MSEKKSNNTPGTAQASASANTGKDSKMNLYLMIGFAVIAIAALFLIFGGGDKK